MARKSEGDPGETQQPKSRDQLTYRGVKFRHVRPLIRTDFPRILDIAELIERGEVDTPLLSRGRANPGGIGPSMRYDVWQQNPRFPYSTVHMFEPDDHLIDGHQPDLVVRDYALSSQATPKSWEIRIWDSPHGQQRAQLGEFAVGYFDLRDLGKLCVGVGMAINAMLPPR